MAASQERGGASLGPATGVGATKKIGGSTTRIPLIKSTPARNTARVTTRLNKPQSASGGGGRNDAGVAELEAQLRDEKASVEGLKQERNFYFGKLRDIKILCQENLEEAQDIIQPILDVLYATEVFHILLTES